MGMSRAERPSKVLERQLRLWRERRGLSAKGLEDRLAEAGETALTRAAISKIENGARGVGLDEWLQLAHALAVPPPLLFLDLETGTDVEVAAGAVVHPWLAWQWVVGDLAPVTTSRAVTRTREFAQSKRAVDLYRREFGLADAVHRAEADVLAAEEQRDRAGAKAAADRRIEALRRLASHLDNMVDADVTPPGLPREWIETMRRQRMLKHPGEVSIFDDGADA